MQIDALRELLAPHMQARRARDVQRQLPRADVGTCLRQCPDRCRTAAHFPAISRTGSYGSAGTASVHSDVDTALNATIRSRESLAALGKTVASLTTYARLARLRYDYGYTSHIEVTDVETGLFNAQFNYARAQQDVLTSVVPVYAAMGGGWIDVADRGTSTGIANSPPVEERENKLPWF